MFDGLVVNSLHEFDVKHCQKMVEITRKLGKFTDCQRIEILELEGLEGLEGLEDLEGLKGLEGLVGRFLIFVLFVFVGLFVVQFSLVKAWMVH